MRKINLPLTKETLKARLPELVEDIRDARVQFRMNREFALGDFMGGLWEGRGGYERGGERFLTKDVLGYLSEKLLMSPFCVLTTVCTLGIINTVGAFDMIRAAARLRVLNKEKKSVLEQLTFLGEDSAALLRNANDLLAWNFYPPV